jgi:hypothetical protein
MRVCRECGQTKPLAGDFVRIKGTNGYYGRCKVCRAAQRRRRYREDPEYHAARRAKERQWHRAHPRQRRQDARPALPRRSPEAILAHVAG